MAMMSGMKIRRSRRRGWPPSMRSTMTTATATTTTIGKTTTSDNLRTTTTCLLLLLLLVMCTIDPRGRCTVLADEVEIDGDGTVTSTTTATSDNDDGGAAAANTNTVNRGFQVHVDNRSRYRADVYYDDGRYGSFVATTEPNGGVATLNTFLGHKFFVTRHGVKENLVIDPSSSSDESSEEGEGDVRIKFTATTPGETFVIPQTAGPSRVACRDRYDICRDTASRGGCTQNPGWMIVHCCESCDDELGITANDLLNPRVRCTRDGLNMTGPAWGPGDLNRLFTSWATSEEFKRYQPKVLSSPGGEHGGIDGPWVVIFDDFLSDEEVNDLVEGGHREGLHRSTDQGAKNALGEQEKIVSTTRTSSNAWCGSKCEHLPGVRSATAKIERVTGVPRAHYESYQILRYEHDQFYRMHHDSSQKDDTPAGHRIMTFFLYLSDVEEGGETYFNKLDLAVKPKRGRALVWPSVTDEDPTYWDDRMYHEARDVIRGKKIAANHWIHLYDYVTPNKWGCTGSFS